MNDTIEGLLGLSFEDFCQCVVLPQGQFADFLKATPKERQDILLKLLGANHYETIGKAASQRASVASEKANLLQIQLGELLEATPEAEEEARNRQARLAALLQTVGNSSPGDHRRRSGSHCRTRVTPAADGRS